MISKRQLLEARKEEADMLSKVNRLFSGQAVKYRKLDEQIANLESSRIAIDQNHNEAKSALESRQATAIGDVKRKNMEAQARLNTIEAEKSK
jgi:hypothetical protein